MASSAPSRRARRRLQIVVSVAAAGIALVVLYLVRDARGFAPMPDAEARRAMDSVLGEEVLPRVEPASRVPPR